MLFLVAKLPEEKIIRKSTRAISSLKYYKFQILHPSKKKIQILGSVLFILLQKKEALTAIEIETFYCNF